MDDLISRAAAIDAIVSATAFPDAEYIKNLCQNPANSEDWLGGVCDAINAVEEVNAVDAVPVVRCRDCKYSDVIYDTTSDTMPLKCLNIRYGGVRPEWFCEHGERRDEGADN